jgi:heme/copper-type cytochrome/quinol oxidase subunit 3
VVLGFMFFITLPLILFLVIIDLITLWLSSMISVYAYCKVLKENRNHSTSLLIVSLICQFFFCADVISLFVTNIAVTRKSAIQ